MKNEKEYIESGILNDYCLGLLDKEQQLQVEVNLQKYPALQKEVDAIHLSLQQYTLSQQEHSTNNLQERIWQTVNNINREEKMTLTSLPLLNKFSDKDSWLKIVTPVLSEKSAGEELFVKVLRDDQEALQTVIWTSVDYPDEIHDDLQECFMVLEGECECYVGDAIIKMGPGDFFEIPMHTHHDVKVLSPHVLAIIQRRKAA